MLTMKLLKIAALICCLHAPLTWSQCAPGVPSAGNPGCIPQDRPESGYFQGNPDQLNGQAQQPQAIWADRWGAIAVDGDTGHAGTVTGFATKKTAIDAAMRDCAAGGPNNCKLRLSYHNQCAAVAWGASHMGFAGAPTESEAQSNAMNGCRKGASDCKIVYSACSLPERIQ
jgi:hypothetical protein